MTEDSIPEELPPRTLARRKPPSGAASTPPPASVSGVGNEPSTSPEYLTGAALEPVLLAIGVLKQTLANRVPQVILDELPDLKPGSPIHMPSLDLTDLLKSVGIPYFTSGNPDIGWAGRLQRKLGRARTVLGALDTLADLGAAPEARKYDIFIAWWEFANNPPQRATRESNAEDSVKVVDDAQAQAWTSQSEERVRRLLSGRAFSPAGSGQWSSESVLGALGYGAGAQHRVAQVRRAALRDAVMFPQKLVPEHRKEFWGVEGTRARVRAIRAHIRLVRSRASGRLGADMRLPLEHWSSDLEWLRAEFESS